MRTGTSFGRRFLAFAAVGFCASAASTACGLGIAGSGALGEWSLPLASALRATVAQATIALAVGITVASATLCAAICAVAGYIATQSLRSRLAQLSDAGALFGAGRLTHRIEVVGHDDIARAGNQLNAMAARLQSQVAALQDAARTQQELQRRVAESAVLSERERVRRELHDRVSQELFGLSMLCGAAVAHKQAGSEQALELVDDIADLARRAQGAMRALLLELRPVELRDRGLVEALGSLCRELTQRTGLTIAFALATPDGQRRGSELPAGVEDALFLIAQEAIVNALRHAAPTRVSVELTLERTRIILSVSDDGVGIGSSLTKMTSIGLRSMAERTESLGGTCSVERAPGGGTRVMAIIPRVEQGELKPQAGGGMDDE
ncbi:MAG: histidine kinase [Firmicutes bacterium]|nr:histidine kinase [Bacillota bacterium]